MLLFFQRLLVIVAFAMVSCAQVFGVLEGYLCGHDSSAGVTQVVHCHENGTIYIPCETPATNDLSDCADLPGTERHAQVATHLTLSPTHGIVAAPIAALPLLLALPASDHSRLQALEASVTTVLRSLHSCDDAPPNTARQVAGCVILLV